MGTGMGSREVDNAVARAGEVLDASLEFKKRRRVKVKL